MNGVDFLITTLVDSLISLYRVMVGFLVGSLVGVVIGCLRAAAPKKIQNSRVFSAVLDFPKFPPPIAWIPVVVLLFGIGEISAVLVVAIGAYGPVTTATYDGLHSIPKVIRNTARSMQLTPLKHFCLVLIPASLPSIVIGLRAGLGIGWMSVVAAEMVCGQSGIGYAIQLNRLNLDIGLVLIDILVIGLLGSIILKGSQRLLDYLFPWLESR